MEIYKGFNWHDLQDKFDFDRVVCTIRKDAIFSVNGRHDDQKRWAFMFMNHYSSKGPAGNRFTKITLKILDTLEGNKLKENTDWEIDMCYECNDGTLYIKGIEIVMKPMKHFSEL